MPQEKKEVLPIKVPYVGLGRVNKSEKCVFIWKSLISQ